MSEPTAIEAQDMPLLPHPLADRLDKVASLLGHVLAAVAAMAPKPDIYQVAVLTPTIPLVINRLDRHYFLLFTPTTITGALVSVFGLANFTVNLSAGWNNLTFPNGSTITGPSGGTSNVVTLVSDIYQNAAV